MFYFTFPIFGSEIPREHSYQFFGAISNILPEIHGCKNIIQIAPVSGKRDGHKIILNKNSRVKIVGLTVKQANILTGKNINIDGNLIHIGEPQLHSMEPYENLFCNCVILKDCFEPEQIQAQIKNKFSDNVEVIVGAKKHLKFKDINKIGYQITLKNLNFEQSINTQMFGIGKMRRQGCGIFYHHEAI